MLFVLMFFPNLRGQYISPAGKSYWSLKQANHHKAANEHQSPILQQLQDKPPDGWLAVVSDWKELISLPISHCASGEQFYASARMEMSTWGACLVEGCPGKAPKRTYYLVISDILDCLRTSQLIDLILSKSGKKAPLEGLALISDPGPHYRAYESLYHYTVVLPKKWQCQVQAHYGAEKHSKSICDRLFGWMTSYVEKAKRHQQDILSLQDMLQVITKGNAEQRERDPSSPHIQIILDCSSKVPKEANRLVPADLKTTRSYCFSSHLDTRVQPSPLGVRQAVWNCKITTFNAAKFPKTGGEVSGELEKATGTRIPSCLGCTIIQAFRASMTSKRTFCQKENQERQTFARF